MLANAGDWVRDYWFVWVSWLGTPVALGIAWRRWAGGRLAPRTWRTVVLLLGLLAASANALVFFSMMAFAAVAKAPPPGWNFIGGNLGPYLSLASAGAAIPGRGAARVSLAVSGFLGFLLWVSIHPVVL